MTKPLLPLLLLTTLVKLFTACDKDDKIDEPGIDVPQYYLKTITWSNGLTGNFVYHPDSSLQRIDYTYQNVGGSTVFGWAGNKLTELYDDRSMYKNVFEYDASGKVVKMKNQEKTPSSDRHYQFQFIYNGANRIDTLKYSITNEAGTQLRGLSIYEYNQHGELAKVITRQGVNEITHTIDAWSPPVSFVAGHYIESTLMENYPIYNLAVMMQLQKANKLPAKVTRVVKTGADPAYVDKIEEHIFTVSNYRIEKVQSTTTYPQMPDYTAHLDAVYSYH
ncbi:hypothetical protein [Longitalea luteola]|uniref:hypothetical protein n=1 Tax=Longitalea luteola TaxID=2812563 RepID=UPI001A968330|nr:hypothetical protein [Longitalea luteola]